MAGGAGIEGLVAAGAGGEFFRAFVARREGGLRDCGRNPQQSRNRQQG